MSHWMTSGANRLRRRGAGRHSNATERSFEREAQARANLVTSKRSKSSSIFRSTNSGCERSAYEQGHAPSRKRFRNGEHQAMIDDEGVKYGERLGLANKRSIKATKLIEVPRSIYNTRSHDDEYVNNKNGYGRPFGHDVYTRGCYLVPHQSSSNEYQDFATRCTESHHNNPYRTAEQSYFETYNGAPEAPYDREYPFYEREASSAMNSYNHTSPHVYSRGEVAVHRILPSKSWHEENRDYDAHLEFNKQSLDNTQAPPFYQHGVPTDEFPSSTPFHHSPFHESEERQWKSNFRDENQSWPDRHYQQSPSREVVVLAPYPREYGYEADERYFSPYSEGERRRHGDYSVSEDHASNRSPYFQHAAHTPLEQEPTVVNPFDEIHHRIQSSCSHSVHPHTSLNGRFMRYRSPCDRNSKVYTYGSHDDSSSHQFEGRAVGADSDVFDHCEFNHERSEPTSHDYEDDGHHPGIAQFQRARQQRTFDTSNKAQKRGTVNESAARHVPFHIPFEGGREGQAVIFFNNGVQVDDLGQPLSSMAAQRSTNAFLRPSRREHSAASRESPSEGRNAKNIVSSPISKSLIQTAAMKQSMSPSLSTKSSQHGVFRFVTGRLPELEAEMNATVTKPMNDTTCDVTNVKDLLRKLYHLSSRQGFQAKDCMNCDSNAKETTLPLPMRLANCIRSLESLKHSLEQDNETKKGMSDNETVVGSTRKNLLESFSKDPNKRDAVLVQRSTELEESKRNSSWTLFCRQVEEGLPSTSKTSKENTSPFDKENKKGPSDSHRDKKYIQMRQRHKPTIETPQGLDKSPCDDLSPRSPVSVSIDPQI